VATTQPQTSDVRTIVRHLHRVVTYGPWDLEIASLMSAHGYDAVKWAEGQCLLAELVCDDRPAGSTLAAAVGWFEEAARAARHALSAQSQLLTGLGLNE
jgi:hypothetical protein